MNTPNHQDPDSHLPAPFYHDPHSESVAQLRRQLQHAHPHDVVTTDKKYIEEWDDYLTSHWLTDFADTTAAAMCRRDEATLRSHLAIIYAAYLSGTPSMQSLIDVSYMEDLFYKADAASAQWAWPFIPEPLRQLHTTFWNTPGPRVSPRAEPS